MRVPQLRIILQNEEACPSEWLSVTMTGCILGVEMEEGHTEIEGSCKHIEKADKDRQKDVVLQFGGVQHANNSSP